MPHDNHSQKWSLESLDKAYQRGYMAGLTGQSRHAHSTHPPAEVLQAAWEAGWDDGNEQHELLRRNSA